MPTPHQIATAVDAILALHPSLSPTTRAAIQAAILSDHHTPELITEAAAAALLGLSPAKLSRWRTEPPGADGPLPWSTYQVSANCLRYDAAELRLWLRSHRRPGCPPTPPPKGPTP